MSRRTRKVRGGRKTRKVAKATKRLATLADPLGDFIAAAARALDLKIEKSWLLAVRANLRVTLRLGAMVADFALPDDAEPAPVFEV